MKAWIIGFLSISIGAVHSQIPADQQQAADQGKPEAQAAVGEIYLSGKGVPKNYVKAMDWLMKAADQGNVQAQNAIGGMYEKGWAAKQDYAQALAWYQKASTQDYAPAEFNIGMLYSEGKGVAKDGIQAQDWLKKALPGLQKAAGQGDANSQHKLGLMYACGLVPKVCRSGQCQRPKCSWGYVLRRRWGIERLG